MLKNQKKGKLKGLMIVLILFATGCQNMSENSLCLNLRPITIDEFEHNNMSENTLRQIDNFNQEFEEICK